MANLWLDFGNTRLKYWLIDDKQQIIAYDAKCHLQAPAELLIGWIELFNQFSLEFIGISSVLGEKINGKIANTLSLLNTPFKFVHVNSQCSLMQSDYDETQLGVDRWLQMLGVVDATKRQCVIGCGTAITIDLIDHAHHLGGYIFPSIYLQRQALSLGTKQINVTKGSFDSIEQGLTTQDAVERGVLLSIVGAINEIINRHDNYEYIITGGDAVLVNQHLHTSATIRNDLLLNGLIRFFSKPITKI